MLGTLHVSGAVLSLAELDAPFAVTSGTTDSGVFHAVLDGEAWAIVDDREPIRLAPGKAAFLPGGAAHLIASDPEPRVVPVPVAVNTSGRFPTMRIANGGVRTRVLCGTITLDRSPVLSPVTALPDLVVTGTDTSAGWVHTTVRLIADELAEQLPASEVVVARLTDVLVVRAVREIIADGLGDGWIAGLRDPAIARALALVHARPDRVGSVSDLAREASMSRSSFYEHFAAVVGMAPGEYVARWRIHMACGRLAGTTQSIAAVARDVGFRTEAGFSTAFRRMVGVPPSVYRRASRDAGAPRSAPIGP